MVDNVGSALGVKLKDITTKATVENDGSYDIQGADAELTLTSYLAAESYITSLKSLQRQLFQSYLGSQRHGETELYKK